MQSLDQAIAEAEGIIPADQREQYRRTLKQRGPDAFAAVTREDKSCGGCFVGITHQMLNELEPFTVLNPSAENIAKFFYDQTNEQLAEMTKGRVRVKDCTIWETDTTTATYFE